MGTTTTGFEPFIFRLKRRHPEIGNFQGKIIIQQQVLRFEITMTNPKRVKVLKSVDELLIKKGRLIRLKKPLGVDIIEQFPLRNVLQGDVAGR